VWGSEIDRARGSEQISIASSRRRALSSPITVTGQRTRGSLRSIRSLQSRLRHGANMRTSRRRGSAIFAGYSSTARSGSGCRDAGEVPGATAAVARHRRASAPRVLRARVEALSPEKRTVKAASST
jgi:hypothetical protein